MTRTSPLASTVAVLQCRGKVIGAVSVITGAGPVMSRSVAARLAANRRSRSDEPPPPTFRILPGWYITAVEVAPQLGRTKGCNPVMLPCPAMSR